MKKTLKKIISRITQIVFRLKNVNKNTYLGYGCKFVGGENIIIEDQVSIMPHSMLVCLRNGTIQIGEGTEIGMYSRIASENSVKIGKNVLTGPHIFIADYNHKYENINIPIKKQGNKIKPNDCIFIDDDTWIGTNVVIVGNVHIGKHCVIGANSVVINDISDFSVAIGSPAKTVKKYNFSSQKWEKTKNN